MIFLSRVLTRKSRKSWWVFFFLDSVVSLSNISFSSRQIVNRESSFSIMSFKIFDSSVDQSFLIVCCNLFSDDFVIAIKSSKICKYLLANIEKVCECLIDDHHYLRNIWKFIEVCIRFSRRDEWLIFFTRETHVANDKMILTNSTLFWNESFLEKLSENNWIVREFSTTLISIYLRAERSISTDFQSNNNFKFFVERFRRSHSSSARSVSIKIVIWLILPIVICLFQKLNHACLNISNYIVKLRMIYMNHFIFFSESSFATLFSCEHCWAIDVRLTRNRKDSIQRLQNNWSIDFDWDIVSRLRKFERRRH